ncbi:unnamed protein product [Hermetia illucens]|uniref:Complex 1 LYR protein domain-containing protein n=1 Tax=Hermetia illucens TaxID=343691 RepID=A0A7R8UEY9_HERIL|nr:electron transfer flavoprotein regulatory factor 1 [Hermetia illucens]CAD7079435.1 unnamed protein product [Hermetia illucens]
MSLRSKVIQLYKHLIYLSREYPERPDNLRKHIHDTFMKNSKETDEKKIKALLAHGRYVAKEIEALYSLRKYRAMKKRYYDDK